MINDPQFSDEILIKIGQRFRQLRLEKGYTNYEQFAFEHDLPRAQYGRYEKGADMRMSSFLRVLQAFDISIKDFFAEGFDN